MCGAGLTFALIANQLSPKGLVLSRNYFPTASAAAPGTPRTNAPTEPSAAAVSAGANANAASDPTPPAPSDPSAQIQAEGFRAVTFEETFALFEDPRRLTEQIIFIDARDDAHFERGHIPGAYAFDRFYPDRYLPEVLPVASVADWVVVYCEGGRCEDSIFAARFLRDAGVPETQIAVFKGGIAEWKSRGGPVELGARHSGTLAEPAESPDTP